jgi:putative endonuclease
MRKGRLAEDLALCYLQLLGAVPVDRNFRLGQKEIDLLVREGDCLVFVEVRYRSSGRFGTALESVSRKKHLTLRRAMREEILRRRWRGGYRLDLLTLDLSSDHNRLVLEHYRGL